MVQPRSDIPGSFYPIDTFYTAPDTNCGSSTGRQKLGRGETAVLIATEPCTTGWTAEIEVAIPEDGLVADTYTSVITHSVA
ncbi:hypothetical protein [Hoyosella subflava]|uniref:Uncharacterized protein n=1 Tax=Hoyosella subflava (strain DSM 45089 / JCM 17490 / NBRC 109087 / DQS3-9A1) TaxID=443218 RepID=F6EHH4_HOYSD|nr:hypothetical protein [Hoyosella subflava]AEF41153.1 hypothetical protein AS9A_2706 [Hoyosella subflava DQS3-9A1]